MREKNEIKGQSFSLREISRSETKIQRVKKTEFQGSKGQRTNLHAPRKVVIIPIIVEPVVVPVPLTIVITIEIEHVPISVRVAKKCIKYRPCHHPLNTLRAVSYSASKCPSILYQVSLFF